MFFAVAVSSSCTGRGPVGVGGCASASYACPATPPSYAQTIAPIVSSSCGACHAPGGQASDKQLVHYTVLASYRTTALSELVTCRMPPATAPPLSAHDKTLLLDWLACGAPQN